MDILRKVSILRKKQKLNSFYNIDIKCPYCFQSFKHDQVAFRVAPLSADTIKQIDSKINNAQDEESIEKYKEEREEAEKFLKSEDQKFSDYWRKKGWLDNDNLFENMEGFDEYTNSTEKRESVLVREHDPVIQSSRFSETEDDDGFVYAAEYRQGEILQKTTKRICPHCHNKLPKDYGKRPVKFMALVGITGSGKTVMLSKLLESMEEYIARAGGQLIPGDCASNFIKAYPVKNNEELPDGNKEHFSPPVFLNVFTGPDENRTITTIVIYDIAGESCVNPEGMDKYGPFVRNADGIIFLLDPEQISAFQSSDQDSHKPTAVLHAMNNAFLLEKEEQCGVPIAVTYSKSDKLKNINDDIKENSNVFRQIDYVSGKAGFMFDSYLQIRTEIRNLLKKYSMSFLNDIERQFSNPGFFSISVLGHEPGKKVHKTAGYETTASIPVDNIVPLRLEEPFLWLLYKWGLIEKISKKEEKISSKNKFSKFFKRGS